MTHFVLNIEGNIIEAMKDDDQIFENLLGFLFIFERVETWYQTILSMAHQHATSHGTTVR